jgi:hypothetical protein
MAITLFFIVMDSLINNDFIFNDCHWVDTSAGKLLVPDGIIRPVISVSALTWLNDFHIVWF